MGRVPAVDVEGLVGFGVTEVFRFGERFGVAESGFGHALKNVVGSAVDDSGEGLDTVADVGFLNRLDDGDGSGDRGFEMNGSLVLGGEGEEFFSTLGEEGLVASDDGFAGFESGGDEVKGGISASDEFDDDVDFGVFDESGEVGLEDAVGGIGFAELVEIADHDATDFKFDAPLGSLGDEVAISGQNIPYSGTYRSESSQANSKGFATHKGHLARRSEKAKRCG